MTTNENSTAGLSILAAISKGDFAAPAKAAYVKAGRKAKTPTKKPVAAKPVKAAKAAPVAKPAKAPKETKVTETTTAPAVDPIDALMAEHHAVPFDGPDAVDTRSDEYIRALLQKAFDAGKAAPRARTARAGGPTKRDLAAALLRRPEGCTSKDILEATGWPAVSVPAIAKASGLSLRQVKEGRVTTYFGS